MPAKKKAAKKVAKKLRATITFDYTYDESLLVDKFSLAKERRYLKDEFKNVDVDEIKKVSVELEEL